MKKQFFFGLISILLFGHANAQKITPSEKEKQKQAQLAREKPGVLVIGNGNAAAAAAIQSAASGVNTTILLQAGGFDLVSPNGDLTSGLQGKFVKEYDKDNKSGGFDKQLANGILWKMADTIKKLTVIKDLMWIKASRSGSSWSFKLSDGSTIRPEVLVNPSDSKLTEALGTARPSRNLWARLDYENTLYRTSVVGGQMLNGTTANIISLYQLMVPSEENLIWIGDPNSMQMGQAAGATAAYAAFFDVKTSKANLKKIQGELIAFKLNLIPFADIETSDSAWKAIQLVGVTGVIKGKLEGATLKFLPSQLVSTEEIKQPLKDLYYKAQIWFDDYKDQKMTLRSTLDLIAYVGNRSLETMNKELPKKWKDTYKFGTPMDLDRQINRKEFAVLLQDYMPPFNVNVDDKGKVVR